MKTWLFTISSFGTNYVQDDSIKRRILFSNVIFLTLPVVYVLFMLFQFETFFKTDITLAFDQFIVPIIVLVCIGSLFLNRFGHFYLSRVTFLLLWPLFLHIIPIVTQQTPTDYYLAYPLGIIFQAVLIQISISAKREPFLFWILMMGNLLLMFFAIDLLSYFDLTPATSNALRTDPFYTLDGILYWLLFNLLVYYLVIVIETSIENDHKSRVLIEIQKEELSEKNIELEQSIESLKDLNNYVEELNKSLEEKIKLRTFELEIKNQKLIEYASFNAHQLRGPFCRIKGLVNLQEDLRNSEHGIDFQKMLITSLDELDSVISHIQKTVETE